MSPAHDLLDRYERVLEGLATRLARGWRIDRDDVRQDLYMLLLVDGCKFDPNRGSLSLWLRWRWNNLHRQRRKLLLLSGDVLSSICVDRRDPGVIVNEQDELVRIRRAVNALPASDRELVHRSFGLEGCERQTLGEIAVSQGLTPQGISRRRQVCYFRLRRLLN